MLSLAKYKTHLIPTLIIIILSLLIWWPSRNLPYHWDSAGYVITTARNILSTNFRDLMPTHGPDVGYAHPPFVPLFYAVAWKIFGENIQTTHLMVLPLMPMLLGSVYFLAYQLKPQRFFALSTTIIVASLPIVAGEYYMVYLDLPMAAFSLTGLMLWIYNRRWWSAFMLACACLIKLPALFVVLAIFASEIAQHFIQLKRAMAGPRDRISNQNSRYHLTKSNYSWLKQAANVNLHIPIKLLPLCQNFISSTYPLIIPILSVVLWLVFHHQQRGWWLSQPELLPEAAPLTINQYFTRWQWQLEVIFWSQRRYILSILTLSLLILHNKKLIKNLNKPIFIYLISYILIALFGYSWLNQFGQRHSIFILPVFILLSWYLVTSQISRISSQLVILGIILIAHFQIWRPTQAQAELNFRGPQDLSSLDMIEIGRQSATYLQQMNRDITILGGFPESYQLTQPHQGYVAQPLEFTECQKVTSLSDLSTHHDLIFYVHHYSPSQKACHALVQYLRLPLLKRFQSGGKWLDLYIMEATQSTNILND